MSDTSTINALGLSASLTVKDVSTSAAWYCDALGFTIDRKYERDGKLMSVAVQSGTVRLLLNQDNGDKGFDRVKGEGFSLMITTAQSVDAIAARIKATGATLASEPADMPWGARVFRVQDPDGFRLAISSDAPRA